MTDYLDSNRKESYEIFDLPTDSLYVSLLSIYPDLSQTKHAKENNINNDYRRNALSAIINHMNKSAINNIEKQNELKNQLICSSYWFNPVSFIQNKWNNYINTDYYSYQEYRSEIQKILDTKLSLLNFESWNETEVTMVVYEDYLKQLNAFME